MKQSTQAEVSSTSRTSTRAWVTVVAVGVIAAAHIWKLPVALPLLEAELGMSLVTSGMLLGIIQLASMVGGLFVAWGGEIAGLRRLMMLGLVLLAIGSCLGATTSSVNLLMTYRALEGIGFLLCTVLAPALIRRICQPAQLDLALSSWGAFQGTATVVGFAGGGLLLEFVSWRALWLVMAALTLVLLLLLARFTVPDPQDYPNQRLRGSVNRIVTTVRTWRPWVAGLAFACYTLQWMAVVGFLPTVFVAADIERLPAALLSAVVGGVNIIGALLAAGLLTRGFNPRHVLLATFAAMAASSVMFFAIAWEPTVQGLMGQLLCALVFSMIGGTVPAILSRLAVDLAPPEGSVAAVIGLMQQIFNVGNFFGPAVLAWVVTTTGSWETSWWVTCSCSALGIVATIYLTRRDRTPGTLETKPAAQAP